MKSMFEAVDQKIFVLTSGHYDDYRIVGVFADRDLAEAVMARNETSYFEMRVEEWLINDLAPLADKARPFYPFLVRVTGDGQSVFECEREDVSPYEMCSLRTREVNKGAGHRTAGTFYMTLWAENEEQAKTIALERVKDFLRKR